MSDSYAGITVPEGEPSALEDAAGRFHAFAGTLTGVSSDLSGMPSVVGSWEGPASVSFASACLTNGGAASAATQALGHAAHASTQYAHLLRSAQQRARQAIADAKDAQHRIDQAEHALTAARVRGAAATATATAASHDIMLASSAGLPSTGSEAVRSQAETDRANAASDEAAAGRALQHARDDLRRAKRDGHQAMVDARDAAHGAAAAFAGAAQLSPAYAIAGAAPSGDRKGAGSFWNTTNDGSKVWDEDQFLSQLLFFHPKNDAVGRYKWWGDRAADIGTEATKDGLLGYAGVLRNQAIRDMDSLVFRSGRTFVAGPGGTVLTQTLSVTRETHTVIDADLLAKSARFGKAGKALPVVGGVLAIGSAGYDQWREDSSDKSLTTTDRVGRSAGVGVYVGGASIAGAAIGTMIFPGVGTVAGLAIGAAGGLVVGAVASSITPLKDAAAAAGQWTANAAVDSYHWTGDRLADAERLREDVNRKVAEGIDTGVDWVKDHTPDIHIPTPHVDLPDLNPF